MSPQTVLINEIAWAGTVASASDEWIELHNPGPQAVDLTGWRLTDRTDGGDIGDINIALSGGIAPFGFFLLERTNDSTVGNLPAHQIYSGSLSNSGEALDLAGPAGELVDSANHGAGAWPAGNAASRASMERRGGTDLPGNWGTYAGPGGPALDAQGHVIQGTPGGTNSFFLPTPAPTPTLPSTPAIPIPPQSVLINEVAWAGTRANASDEWIELHNPGPEPISLAGWVLTDGGDVKVSLAGSLPPYGFYLLERSDDQTVADVRADRIYTGGLNNAGEVLRLLGPQAELVDSANGNGGGWPAGSASTWASMERRGGSDLSGDWGGFTGYHGVGHDAEGNFIRGTPRSVNSLFFPTPVPTWIPGRVVINEVLIRPRHDWEGAGGVTTADEFIELYNHGPGEVYLRGWWLDDIADGGSSPGDLPGITIPEHGYAVFFRSFTGVALNDGGDSVRLLAPNGRQIDQISYLPVRAYNLSYGRLPDGSGHLAYGLWPTPGKANLLFEEPIPPGPPGPFYPGICPGEAWPSGGKVMRASLERRGLQDNPGSWVAFAGNRGLGRDARGDPLAGTPGGANWSLGGSGALPWLLGDPPMQPPPILINEIAWAGTRASAADEWIELYNPGDQAQDLAGWILSDGNDLHVELAGAIAPGAYYLLEREDDQTISDLPADQVYSGRLDDAGETLWLMDSHGQPVDSANAVGPGAPHPLLPRAVRGPAQFAWLRELGMISCR
ncbi:MAG TPA: lamin tail domain-containing protein [Anaerolineales bacterium]